MCIISMRWSRAPRFRRVSACRNRSDGLGRGRDIFGRYESSVLCYVVCCGCTFHDNFQCPRVTVIHCQPAGRIYKQCKYMSRFINN